MMTWNVMRTVALVSLVGLAAHSCRNLTASGEGEKPEAAKIEKADDGAVVAQGASEGENSQKVSRLSSEASPALSLVACSPV